MSLPQTPIPLLRWSRSNESPHRYRRYDGVEIREAGKVAVRLGIAAGGNPGLNHRPTNRSICASLLVHAASNQDSANAAVTCFLEGVV